MLSIQDLCQTWTSPQKWTLQNISFEVFEGEFVTLLGPSGCGKTTLLRCLAGFLQPTSGDILYQGKSLIPVPARQRPFHMVFQSAALFPHLNIFENIAFSLRLKKWSEDKIRIRVQELLSLMQLEGYDKKRPEQLSGGQGQRVALARALADGTQFLLLDEPLSALDEKQRSRLRDELQSLQKLMQLTVVMVTHDQTEALSLSNRIVVLNNSRIEQIGSPQDLYLRPQTTFVAEFMGKKNRLLENSQETQYLNSDDFSLQKSPGSDLSFLLTIENQYYLGTEIEIRAKTEDKQEWVLHFPKESALELKNKTQVQVHSFSQKVIRVRK